MDPECIRKDQVKIEKMCWHELKKFCCCFSIKTGVYVAILVNIAVSSVGIIVGHYYLKSIEQDPYRAMNFDAEKNRVTVISIILGVGKF